MPQENSLYSNYQDWKSWDEFFLYTSDHSGYLSFELAQLKIEGADVLEIGFGSGSCVAWMAEHGARISVTEISERSCAAAREHGFEVISSDLPTIAADHAGRFDTIIAFDVFEHLELTEVDRYLDACVTMLKSGGRLLLRFPNSQSPFGLKHQAGDPTHKAKLSLAVFNLMIIGKPLQVKRYAGSHLYPGKPMTPVWVKRIVRRGLQKLLNGLLNFIYASGIPYEPVVVLVLEKKSPGEVPE